jgi:hypothetical protein
MEEAHRRAAEASEPCSGLENFHRGAVEAYSAMRPLLSRPALSSVAFSFSPGRTLLTVVSGGDQDRFLLYDMLPIPAWLGEWIWRRLVKGHPA